MLQIGSICYWEHARHAYMDVDHIFIMWALLWNLCGWGSYLLGNVLTYSHHTPRGCTQCSCSIQCGAWYHARLQHHPLQSTKLFLVSSWRSQKRCRSTKSGWFTHKEFRLVPSSGPHPADLAAGDNLSFIASDTTSTRQNSCLCLRWAQTMSSGERVWLQSLSDSHLSADHLISFKVCLDLWLPWISLSWWVAFL